MARRVRKNSKGAFLIICIVLILFGAISIRSLELNQKKEDYNKQIANLQEEIEEAKETKDDLEKQEAYMKTDQYIKEIAKEKLNLVEKNEIVFKAKE